MTFKPRAHTAGLFYARAVVLLSPAMPETPDMDAPSTPTPQPKGKRTLPKTSDLTPVDWPAIEPHYKAGVLSVSAIAQRFGVSRAAIYKHADKQVPPWTRSALPAVLARAEALVTQQTFDLSVTGSPEVNQSGGKSAQNEARIVEASAEAVAIVLMGQRASIKRADKIANSLMRELEQYIDSPELAAQVTDALSRNSETSLATLSAIADLITSLPERAKTLKILTDSLARVIELQRVSYGLDTHQKPPEEHDSFESLRDLAEGAK